MRFLEYQSQERLSGDKTTGKEVPSKIPKPHQAAPALKIRTRNDRPDKFIKEVREECAIVLKSFRPPRL